MKQAILDIYRASLSSPRAAVAMPNYADIARHCGQSIDYAVKTRNSPVGKSYRRVDKITQEIIFATGGWRQKVIF